MEQKMFKRCSNNVTKKMFKYFWNAIKPNLQSLAKYLRLALVLKSLKGSGAN